VIAEFYRDRHVLITGATGFHGQGPRREAAKMLSRFVHHFRASPAQERQKVQREDPRYRQLSGECEVMFAPSCGSI
jgi:hypothetical protein